jgi:hypothetical protein
MNGIFLAAAVAVAATTSVASGLLVTGARGPSSLRRSARLGLSRSCRRLKRLVDTGVAAMLARRERQAATSLALREMAGGVCGDISSGTKRRSPDLVDRTPSSLHTPDRRAVSLKRIVFRIIDAVLIGFTMLLMIVVSGLPIEWLLDFDDVSYIEAGVALISIVSLAVIYAVVADTPS